MLARLIPLCLLSVIASAASAQVAATPLPDDVHADRRRATGLLREPAQSAGQSLLRATSTLLRDDTTGGPALRLLAPTARVVSNSEIPFSINEGTLWAGRGLNALLRAGAHGSWRFGRTVALDVVLSPELAYSANRPFPRFPYRTADRSAFASPWHGTGPASADLPLRFGDEAITRLTPGQSSITLRAGGIALGAATENHWWGPGMRSALVLGTNAEGFPHAFVRTAQPTRVPGGHLEAVLLAGTLTESRFFDTTTANDYRAFSGLGLTYRFAAEPGLTIGAARGVITPVERADAAIDEGLSALARWETVRATTDTTAEGALAQRSDQVTSLFWRWAFAPHGFEFYGEWARIELPRSLREWLGAPHNTQGWTLGLQWARPLGDGTRLLRVHGEATNLEQTRTFSDRPAYPDFYTGRATEHGYTHRGRVLGAGIGPGASAQWLAGDWLAPAWRAGLVLGRIRWDNDALYREIGANYFRHDVSLMWGLRAGAEVVGLDLGGELTVQKRLNYLFQNSIAAPGPNRTVDVHNLTLALTLAPLPSRTRRR